MSLFRSETYPLPFRVGVRNVHTTSEGHTAWSSTSITSRSHFTKTQETTKSHLNREIVDDDDLMGTFYAPQHSLRFAARQGSWFYLFNEGNCSLSKMQNKMQNKNKTKTELKTLW